MRSLVGVLFVLLAAAPARATRIQLIDKIHQTFPSRVVDTTAASRAKGMRRKIQSGNTPAVALFPTTGMIKLSRPTTSTFEWPVYQVEGIGHGPSGMLPVQALLPVSGHDDHGGSPRGFDATTARANARKFAQTTTFRVEVLQPGAPRPFVALVKARGLVTSEHLDLPLARGRNIVSIYPLSSGGVAAFRAGRQLALDWNP